MNSLAEFPWRAQGRKKGLRRAARPSIRIRSGLVKQRRYGRLS